MKTIVNRDTARFFGTMYIASQSFSFENLRPLIEVCNVAVSSVLLPLSSRQVSLRRAVVRHYFF